MPPSWAASDKISADEHGPLDAAMNLPGIPELFFMAVPLVFFALVILVLAKLVKPNGPSRSAGALQLLEDRYARGEITREEFLERKAVLLGRPSTG